MWQLPRDFDAQMASKHLALSWRSSTRISSRWAWDQKRPPEGNQIPFLEMIDQKTGRGQCWKLLLRALSQAGILRHQADRWLQGGPYRILDRSELWPSHCAPWCRNKRFGCYQSASCLWERRGSLPFVLLLSQERERFSFKLWNRLQPIRDSPCIESNLEGWLRGKKPLPTIPPEDSF